MSDAALSFAPPAPMPGLARAADGPAQGPAQGSVRRTLVRPAQVRARRAAAMASPVPADDPVRRFSRWVRRSFTGTDDASASVIGAWMTAMFLVSAGQRLADDLARLGHVADGTAPSMTRAAARAHEIAGALRSSPTAAQRRHVTASQLDEIRRQLRLETGTLSRRLASLAADADDPSRRTLVAVVEAATWLAVQDLRGAVEELCAADAGRVVGVTQTLDAFHRAVGSTLRPRGPHAGRVVRARPRRS